MKSTRKRLAASFVGGVFVMLLAMSPAAAQSTDDKPKTKTDKKAVRTVKVSDLTLSEAKAKARELVMRDAQKDRFYVKSVDVSVGRLGVRYTVTFQTYLPRTRYQFAASRAALDEAITVAREHGGTVITDLKAYKHKKRIYYSYVSRVVAQRDSRLSFRVIADLSDVIFKETIDIQKKFGRRLVRGSEYYDRNDKKRHAMLFVDRNLKVNKPNFRFRLAK